MTAFPRLLLVASLAATASAQKVANTPATDSAAQASPAVAPPKVAAIDSASEASPAPSIPMGHGGHLAAGTEVRVRLTEGVDSGSAKNGQTISGKLTEPVRSSSGATMPAGTPVAISVIATVPAGKITAMGELSLEAVRIGAMDLDTDIRTYRGQEGKRDVADAVPALGTNAGLAAGTEITFHVAGMPQPATGAPKNSAITPGSVNGRAVGSQASTQGTNSGEPTYGTSTTH